MRRFNRSLGAAAAAAAVLAASGCGSSEEASPTVTWADGLCSAFTTYTNTLREAGTNLKNAGLSQSAFQDAANNVTEATQTFASDIEDLGTPETSAGEAAKQTIDDLASNLEEGANEIKDATSGSSTLNAISSVSATLATAQDQVTTALNDLTSLGATNELEQAFAEAPACESVPGLS